MKLRTRKRCGIAALICGLILLVNNLWYIMSETMKGYSLGTNQGEKAQLGVLGWTVFCVIIVLFIRYLSKKEKSELASRKMVIDQQESDKVSGVNQDENDYQ